MLKKTQTGISLIELLIGMFLGILVVVGGVSVFTSATSAQSSNIKLAKTNQEIRNILEIMVRDIRRAGFLTTDPISNFTALKNNIFFDDATENHTSDIAVYNDNTCFVYAYNANNDSPPVISDDERFGFRLNNDTGVIEIRINGDTNENCNNGKWEPITDGNTLFTDLQFVISSAELNISSMHNDKDDDGCADGDDSNPTTASTTCKTGNYGNNLCDTGEACNVCTLDGAPDPACLYIRTVTITATGRSKDDASITQTITEQVRIRNDKYIDEVK